MAGRPMLANLATRIAELGGDRYVLDQIEDGVRVSQIAAKLQVSRALLSDWRDLDEDRKAGWHLAMKASAEAHAERGLDELESLERKDVTSAEVQLGDKKSKYRQWLAGKRDPATFAEKGLELNFSVGEIHLNAVASGKDALAALLRSEPAPGLIESGSESDGSSDIVDAEWETIEAMAGDPAEPGLATSAEGYVETHASPTPLPDPLADLFA